MQSSDTSIAQIYKIIRKARAGRRVVRVVKVFRVLSAHDPKDLNDSKDLTLLLSLSCPEDYAARHVHGGRYFCGKNAKP